jgi:hypothetical protein
MSHVTLEFHQVPPKRLPSLYYVWCKPCTYLASRLALSPNGPKQAPTWASSPRRTVVCIQNDFYIWGKSCTYLALTLTPSPNGPKRDLTWPASPKFYRVCPKRLPSLWYVWRKQCTYLASRLALSPNRPKRASTWASLPRSTIRCVQTNFWAQGTFGANRAPISL